MRTAVVTGADRGLGFALTKCLLADGFVVFAGQYMPAVPDLAALHKVHADRIHLVPLDVSSDRSVAEAVGLIAGEVEHLDLLVNNAAILGDTEATILDTLDFEGIKRVFDVNALGALRVTNAFAALLLKGTMKLVVTITSEAGCISASYRSSWFGYCMSKAALNMQATLVHNAIAGRGGQVILVQPGYMKTWMHGTRNDSADIAPETSAEGIMRIIADRQKYRGRAAFVDYRGNPMPW